MEYLSTTILAKELDIEVNDLFYNLKSFGWIDRINEKWVLTSLGKQKGGQTRTSEKFGEYIVWPESILKEKWNLIKEPTLITATTLGKHFSVSPQRLNLILSELGWVEKNIAGWVVTKLGKTVGGRQYEHDTSGSLFVMWPEEILKNSGLASAFSVTSEVSTIASENINLKIIHTPPITTNFREKFEAKFRAKDGHYVRSRAELIIDDTLYDYGLVHAYEKKVPIEEDLYTDFYLPSSKVFIEFWGLENDPQYQNRKKMKLELYNKYEFKLIELNDTDISNLDDYLPRKLLKFGVKVY